MALPYSVLVGWLDIGKSGAGRNRLLDVLLLNYHRDDLPLRLGCGADGFLRDERNDVHEQNEGKARFSRTEGLQAHLLV